MSLIFCFFFPQIVLIILMQSLELIQRNISIQIAIGEIRRHLDCRKNLLLQTV